jgi:signal peptidase I
VTAQQQQSEGFLAAAKPVFEIIVVALFLTTFLVQPFRIPSASMQPTLLVGDFLLADKQSFAPTGPLDRLLPPTTIQRGELAIFHWPVDPSMHLVKRIVGLPGDRLRLRSGRVLLNGQPLAEPYAFYSPSHPSNFRDNFPSLREVDPSVEPRWWIQLRHSITDNEITVPPGQYFVLGDNRNDSEDSRYWGFVPRDAFVARPLLVYFAFPQDPTPSSLKHSRTSLRIVH